MTDTATDNRPRSAPRPHRRLLVVTATIVSAVLSQVCAAPASAEEIDGGQNTGDRHTRSTAVHKHAAGAGPSQLDGALIADNSPVDPTADADTAAPIWPPVAPEGLASSAWLGGHNKCKRRKGGREMLPWCAETNRWASLAGPAPRTAGTVANRPNR